MKKLNEELLNEVRQTQSSMQYILTKVGEFYVEQNRATQAFEQMSEKLEELKEKIREEHGDVEINLETGEITESKQEE
jgi:hypothetical protein